MFHKAFFISFQKQLFLQYFIDKQKSLDNLKKLGFAIFWCQFSLSLSEEQRKQRAAVNHKITKTKLSNLYQRSDVLFIVHVVQVSDHHEEEVGWQARKHLTCNLKYTHFQKPFTRTISKKFLESSQNISWGISSHLKCHFDWYVL